MNSTFEQVAQLADLVQLPAQTLGEREADDDGTGAAHVVEDVLLPLPGGEVLPPAPTGGLTSRGFPMAMTGPTVAALSISSPRSDG